ncbi:hypothetical protein KSP40_PGU004798 [Platanthera guangdongensis]|uniref:Ubiquitin-like protease family profile domain-containing protein n=1 Tax=Platanthera guangdongensis TaxID=2320717 RepID=A0ABR2MYL3_9ASPA
MPTTTSQQRVSRQRFQRRTKDALAVAASLAIAAVCLQQRTNDAFSSLLSPPSVARSAVSVRHLRLSTSHYYKSNKVTNSKILLSHITLASVTASDVVLIPCHVSSHWTLLVCRQKEQCWDFYDSFKSGRHRSNLPDLALSAETISW